MSKLEGIECPWPGHIAPRLVAARVLDAIEGAPAQDPLHVLEEVIAAHPGCAADIVRDHVASARLRLASLTRASAAITHARECIAAARAVASRSA